MRPRICSGGGRGTCTTAPFFRSVPYLYHDQPRARRNPGWVGLRISLTWRRAPDFCLCPCPCPCLCLCLCPFVVCRALHFTGCLGKPFNLDGLQKALRATTHTPWFALTNS